jgi:hypothetical protein
MQCGKYTKAITLYVREPWIAHEKLTFLARQMESGWNKPLIRRAMEL